MGEKGILRRTFGPLYPDSVELKAGSRSTSPPPIASSSSSADKSLQFNDIRDDKVSWKQPSRQWVNVSSNPIPYFLQPKTGNLSLTAVNWRPAPSRRGSAIGSCFSKTSNQPAS